MLRVVSVFGVVVLALFAFAPAALAEQSNATILKVDAASNSFTATVDGKEYTFFMKDTGKVTLANDQKGKLADLKAGDEVTIKFDIKDNKNWVNDVIWKKSK